VTNNNGGNGSGTLIFSLDSLSLWLPQFSNTTADTTINIVDIPIAQIQFDLNTMVDSLISTSSFNLNASFIDSMSVIHTYLDTTRSFFAPTIEHKTFDIRNNGEPYGLTVFIQLHRNDSSVCFISLKNIKVFKF
jgi:hypothetical protein